MIEQSYIEEWRLEHPWNNPQAEQDLVISRAIVEIFSDDLLRKSVAFRGGTALHKLYITPQARYSEDIDIRGTSRLKVKSTLRTQKRTRSF